MTKKEIIFAAVCAVITTKIINMIEEKRHVKRQMEDLKAMMKMRPKQWWEELG